MKKSQLKGRERGGDPCSLFLSLMVRKITFFISDLLGTFTESSLPLSEKNYQ